MIVPGDLVRSLAFYPITAFFVGAVGILMLVTSGVTGIATGIVLLALLGLTLLTLSTLRELRSVRKLVDGQRSELLARIDQLVDLLDVSGVIVPPRGAKEQAARDGPVLADRRERDL